MRGKITIISFIVCLYSFGSQRPSLTFKQNKNQWPAKVSFAADLSAGQVFIEKGGLTWVLYNYTDIKRNHDKAFQKEKDQVIEKEDIVHGHVFKMEFLNGQLSEHTSKGQQPEYYNYFLGNDPAQWASDVKAYEQVSYVNVYKNIDVKFFSNGGNFKYDLIIKPGGHIDEIKLRYRYANGINLVNNKLVIHTSVGDVIENIPEAYQIIGGKKIKVECDYVLLEKDLISFKAAKNYDPSYDLIIDPSVVVASYSGTESVSFGLGVAPDIRGNMYLYSINITKHYPVTVGAIQSNFCGGFYDCALSKFNSAGTSKRFSTYIGGNKDDLIINCVIQNDEVAIFGSTRSDTFPIINSGFQTMLGGIADYFIIKLDTSGKTMIGSTYLGGTRAEGTSNVGNASAYINVANGMGEMVMDQWNNCYVIGSTNSHDFPTTQDCYRMYSDSNGSSDIIITKFNNQLTSQKWSTYYGGSIANSPIGIRISRTGKVYCGGTTNSRNFPTSPGVVFTTSVSTLDMVAFTLDTLAGFPIESSYMGAKLTEALRFDIDQNDNVYFIGYCLAPASITVTPGAYNANVGNCVFYKVNSTLSQINAIARFGYANPVVTKIEFDAFNVDSCGSIYFGGFGSGTLPVTPDALKPNPSPNGNVYVGIFNSSLSALKYATYFGGPGNSFGDHDDGGLNYFDDRGYFYHALCVDDGLPVTANAYSTYNIKDSLMSGSTRITNSDAFIKLDLQTFVNANSSLGSEIKSCSPITTTFVATPNLGSVTIIPGDGSPAVISNTLVHSYNTHGTYTAMIIAGSDSTTCNITDSIKILVKYGPSPVPTLEDRSVNCMGNTLFLDAGNSGANYLWSTGETTQIIKPEQSGVYKVKVENEYCRISDSTYVTVEEGHDFSIPNAFTPNGDGENESFCLKGWDHCHLTFKVMIFDRWGEKVFESEDPNFCWNGYYKGKLLTSDVFIYNINATYKGDQQMNKKGNITLIR